MAPLAVAGRQPRAVHGGLHQGLAGAPPLGIVVVDGAVAGDEAVEREVRAAQGQGREQDVAVLHRPAVVVPEPLEEDLEAVAAPNLALKVDVPAEHVDDVHDDPRGDAGAPGGNEQAVVDPAVAADEDGVERPHGLPDVEPVLRPARGHAALRVDLHRHRYELPGRSRRSVRRRGAAERGRQLLSDPEAAEVEDRSYRRDRGVGLAPFGAGAAQHLHQRVAAAHGDAPLLDGGFEAGFGARRGRGRPQGGDFPFGRFLDRFDRFGRSGAPSLFLGRRSDGAQRRVRVGVGNGGEVLRVVGRPAERRQVQRGRHRHEDAEAEDYAVGGEPPSSGGAVDASVATPESGASVHSGHG